MFFAEMKPTKTDTRPSSTVLLPKKLLRSVKERMHRETNLDVAAVYGVERLGTLRANIMVVASACLSRSTALDVDKKIRDTYAEIDEATLVAFVFPRRMQFNDFQAASLSESEVQMLTCLHFLVPGAVAVLMNVNLFHLYPTYILPILSLYSTHIPPTIHLYSTYMPPIFSIYSLMFPLFAP